MGLLSKGLNVKASERLTFNFAFLMLGSASAADRWTMWQGTPVASQQAMTVSMAVTSMDGGRDERKVE